MYRLFDLRIVILLLAALSGCISKRTYIFQDSRQSLQFSEIRVKGKSFEAYGGGDQLVYTSVGSFEDRDSILVFTREKRNTLRYQDSVVFLRSKEKGITIVGVNNGSDHAGFRTRYGYPMPSFEALYENAAVGDSFRIEIPEDSVSVFVNILFKTSFQRFFPNPGIYQAVWDLETFGSDYILDEGSFENEIFKRKKDTIFVKSGRDKLDTSYFVRVRDERKDAPLNELWRYRKYAKPM